MVAGWAMRLASIGLAIFAPLAAEADVVTLEPVADNTMFERCPVPCPDGGSNGAGIYSFTGATAFFGNRRAVLAFDVAGSLPAGATVTSVELTLHASQPGNTGPRSVSLHRMTRDWGEGASDTGDPGGQGVPPEPGDTSWIHARYDTALWTGPGADGDFEVAASASQTVDAPGFYTWSSTPTLVGDVQGWLDDPASDFGWILLGDEASSESAKRFDSREHTTAANRPLLQIEYAPAPEVPALSALGAAATVALLLATATLALARRERALARRPRRSTNP